MHLSTEVAETDPRLTFAVNVACELATRHPDDVVLIDASLQGGSCAMMLDLKPNAGLVDAAVGVGLQTPVISAREIEAVEQGTACRSGARDDAARREAAAVREHGFDRGRR